MTTATRSRPAAPAPTRGGADRRVAALTAELVRDLPPPGALSVPAAARAAHLAARRSSLPAGQPLVVVARNEDEAHRLADDLAAWLPSGGVRVLPERAAMPLERALPEHDESAERLRVLAWLAGQPRGAVLVAPLAALAQRTLTVAQLDALRLQVRVGERINQTTLLGSLVAAGYDIAVEVSGVGEFAARGGIVDVWPPGAAEPVRIDLFGDEVESIRGFDPVTQASRRRLEEVVLLPAGEFLPVEGWAALPEQAPRHLSEVLQADLARLEQGDLAEAAETWAALLAGATTADHLPAAAYLALTDDDELNALASALDTQAGDRRNGLVAEGELPRDWPLPYDAAATLQSLRDRAIEALVDAGGSDAGYGPAPMLPGRLDRLGGWIAEMGDRRVVISTDQASRVGELLEEAGLPASAVAELREPPMPGAIGLVHGSLSGGFVHEPLGLVLLTDRELFGATRIRRLTPSKRVVARDLVGKLEPGDLVVHVDHGIARYAGMTQREYGGDVKEYLQLDFAGADKIFLPADQIGRITRYS
ncbi:MAG TPA: CarD family transcriptional regulator, partial [Candidatus Limnocylindria bacterium]|nr:CarD family transcriptional regulator [Candidatus Limnocylindria bacterium]